MEFEIAGQFANAFSLVDNASVDIYIVIPMYPSHTGGHARPTRLRVRPRCSHILRTGLGAFWMHS